MLDDDGMLEIAVGSWTASVSPVVGGALASLRFGGVDILRPAARGSADPLQYSSFPLVPYCNRIAHGRFRWSGAEHELPLNFGDHPHTLHGLGWQDRWKVIERQPESIVLHHRHGGGPGWPWAYQAEQRIALGENGLSLELTVINLADERAPFSLGFHPYFEAPSGTILRTDVKNLWLADETCIPVQRVGGSHFGDWSKGDSVERNELIDHSFGGWSGLAEVVRPDLSQVIRLTASPELPNLHLYMPPGSSFFCAEPVSHMPDALNRPDADQGEGMQVLQPGETLTVWMRIEVGG